MNERPRNARKTSSACSMIAVLADHPPRATRKAVAARSEGDSSSAAAAGSPRPLARAGYADGARREARRRRSASSRASRRAAGARRPTSAGSRTVTGKPVRGSAATSRRPPHAGAAGGRDGRGRAGSGIAPAAEPVLLPENEPVPERRLVRAGRATVRCRSSGSEPEPSTRRVSRLRRRPGSEPAGFGPPAAAGAAGVAADGDGDLRAGCSPRRPGSASCGHAPEGARRIASGARRREAELDGATGAVRSRAAARRPRGRPVSRREGAPASRRYARPRRARRRVAREAPVVRGHEPAVRAQAAAALAELGGRAPERGGGESRARVGVGRARVASR